MRKLDESSAPEDAVATRPLPGAVLGDFHLLDLLGRGGMAEVWRASWGIGPAAKIVAIKRALPEIAAHEDLRRMFLTEVAWAIRLSHPQIVRSFYVGEAHGLPYFAMELLDGVDLRSLIRNSPQALPVAFAIHVAMALANALAYLRSLKDENGRPLGLVHLDVSPSNVMICRDGSIKLLDFGVAKALGDRAFAVTRHLKGKTGYMAPELASKGRYDHRVDVFGVGVVLYELLTHRRFRAQPHLRQRAGSRPPVPPSTINPAVSSRLDEIVLKSIANDPEERYATADELERDLGEIEAPWTPERTQALLARVVPPALLKKQAQNGETPPPPTEKTASVIELSQRDILEAPSTGALAIEQSPAEPEPPEPTEPALAPRSSVVGFAAFALVALVLGFVVGRTNERERPPAPPPGAAPPSEARPVARVPLVPAIAPPGLPIDPSTTLIADSQPSRVTPADRAAIDKTPTPTAPPRPLQRPSRSDRRIASRFDLAERQLVNPYANESSLFATDPRKGRSHQ